MKTPTARGSGRRGGARHTASIPARAMLAVAAALAGSAVPAFAQIAPDTPRLIGPDSPGGLGIYWLRSSTAGDETDALMGTWALPGSGRTLILRGGAGLNADDDISAFGGIDLRVELTRHTAEQPLDITWTSGIGAGGRVENGEYYVVTLPVGISVGRSWSSGSIWLAPYVSMGVALDYSFGDDAPDEEFGATPAADLGLDLALDPGRNFIIRSAMSFGDRQALVVGLVVGGGP